MDEATLRARLWAGFARLQTLLGEHGGDGAVLERDGFVASIVSSNPDSPTLNAVVPFDPAAVIGELDDLRERYKRARVRRWGIWLDGHAAHEARALTRAGFAVTAASPGMGVVLDDLPAAHASPNGSRSTDLVTVGRVNDRAYGNYDARLERTLAPLPSGVLHAYRADLDGAAASVAMALHQDGDCGVSFVATAPKARRRGLGATVMRHALADARAAGCTTSTLQATDVGEPLYVHLGYHRLCSMQLWERRR
jgi:ribosomal protein S18 acetylase RimI-like enzyme